MSKINGLFFLVCILALGSCSVSKYLTEDQHLVKKNKVVIEDSENSRDDADLIYNLESLVLQKPNTNHFFTPREYIYFKNKEEFEKTGKKKGRIKEAQPPVLHSDKEMQKTAERMEKYLRNSKGFYFAKVVPKAYLSKKQAEITYSVYTDTRYRVRSKEYFIEDPEVEKLLNTYESRTLILKGSKIDESVFEEEKTRIFTRMQNKGYAAFAKNYIEFTADSSNMEMDVFVRIVAPPNKDSHQKYTNGKITIYPNYRGTIDDNSPFAKTYNGIEYQFASDDPFIKASTLARSIQIKEGEMFRKRNVDNTYSSLAKLGTYRFINITSDVNPENDSIIDFNVFLTPIDDIWAVDASLNLFYTFLARDGGNINRLGLSGITSLTNINTFGGGEKLTLSTEITSEVTIPELNTNLTFTAQAGLKYPILVDYYGLTSRLFKPFFNDDQFIKIRNNTVTDHTLSYSYVRQIDQYITHSINGTISYEFRPEKKFYYVFTPFNINSLSTRVDPIFKEQFLDDSPLFALSFDKRFITTFGIPQLLYQMNSPIFSNGFNWNLKINTEISGAEITGVNYLYNFLTGNEGLWAIELGPDNIFEFSRFALIDTDINATQVIKGKHSISGRYHMGVAAPFFKNDVIPFIRQFYVGGANSLRAWQTRELGPGGYFQDNSGNVVFFQSGDIVLEASLEYRFPIWYLFEGAVFVDAGNVWTLQNDAARPGSQFKFDDFYNQIAIGTGFGIRMDLSFLIIRLDMGYRLRNPYQDDEFKFNYWSYPDGNLPAIAEYIRTPNFTIGLNYPF